MQVQRAARQILLHGLSLVMAGIIWGIFAPMTPYPRLGLAAHIQFTSNGMLFMILAILLLKVPNRVGPKSALVMLAAAWLIWPLLLSEVANAWWGTNQMLSLAAAQAGATGGEPWQELVVKIAHIVPSLLFIPAWGLLVVGFIGKNEAGQSRA